MLPFWFDAQEDEDDCLDRSNWQATHPFLVKSNPLELETKATDIPFQNVNIHLLARLSTIPVPIFPRRGAGGTCSEWPTLLSAARVRGFRSSLNFSWSRQLVLLVTNRHTISSALRLQAEWYQKRVDSSLDRFWNS